MLPASACKSGKGHMAAMERLLAAGSPVEPSAEELAHEKVAVKMVHREMSEADEANLLEKEDMHVFEREPLADRLPLVSCNTCKKPIKASQYPSHAERCRSLMLTEDTATETDGGAHHKKPPRKARKKLLVAPDNTAVGGDRERLHSIDADDAAGPDSVGTSAGDHHDQFPGRSGFVNSKGQKRVMNISEGTVLNSTKAGRSRKALLRVSPDGSTSTEDGSGALGGSTGTMLKHSELDVLCGVPKEDGAPCRQRLTCQVHPESSKRAVTGRRRPYDVLLQELKGSLNRLRSSKVHDSGNDPLPMTTKIYYMRHHHRMRAVLGNLFREACARNSSRSPSPSSVSSEKGGPMMTSPPVLLDNSTVEASQQRVQSLVSDKKMQTVRAMPDGGSPRIDQNRGHSGPSSIQGSHPDSSFPPIGTFGSNSQFVYGKGRPVSSLLGVSPGGDFSVCLP